MNPCYTDAQTWAQTLIQSRRTTLPKRLIGPGPNMAQKMQILQAAAAAPDHDQILPWRFIEVPDTARPSLGQAFRSALLERDPQASEEECLQAAEKATRSPWLLLAVVRTKDHLTEIPASERFLSAGAAIQNMLLMCSAIGLGSSLTSGKAMQSDALRSFFSLSPQENALCFVNIGHIRDQRTPRIRPAVTDYFTVLS